MLPDGGPGGMRATSVERARGGGTTLSNTSQVREGDTPRSMGRKGGIINNINNNSN